MNLEGVLRFIITMVVPLTTWFVAIRLDASANARDIESVKQEVKLLKNEAVDKEKRLMDKLEEVQRSLGRIEGRLQ